MSIKGVLFKDLEGGICNLFKGTTLAHGVRKHLQPNLNMNRSLQCYCYTTKLGVMGRGNEKRTPSNMKHCRSRINMSKICTFQSIYDCPYNKINISPFPYLKQKSPTLVFLVTLK
jgi:hypothetical protein